MTVERTTEMPVRHAFTDYVCTVGYSEVDEEFRLIAIRRARSNKPVATSTGEEIFRKILRNPPLRATLLEQLTPDLKGQIIELREEAIRDRAKGIGFAIGFASFVVLGILLYQVTIYLSRHIGRDWAEIATYIPTFFAFVIIFPVQGYVSGLYRRRHCEIHSHLLDVFKDKDGREVTRCKRCSLRFYSKPTQE